MFLYVCIFDLLKMYIDNLPSLELFFDYEKWSISMVFWVRYSKTDNQVTVATANVRSDDFNLATWKPLFSSFLVSSNRLIKERDLVIRFGVSHPKDHGYAPFLVITIRSYPYSWFITGLVTRVTWQNSQACPRIFTCFNEVRVVRVVKLYGFMFFSSVFCLTTIRST
jgi:hypothetical protein